MLLSNPVGSLNRVSPVHKAPTFVVSGEGHVRPYLCMQRGCFHGWTCDLQLSMEQSYCCTKARPQGNLHNFHKKAILCYNLGHEFEPGSQRLVAMVPYFHTDQLPWYQTWRNWSLVVTSLCSLKNRLFVVLFINNHPHPKTPPTSKQSELWFLDGFGFGCCYFHSYLLKWLFVLLVLSVREGSGGGGVLSFI